MRWVSSSPRRGCDERRALRPASLRFPMSPDPIRGRTEARLVVRLVGACMALGALYAAWRLAGATWEEGGRHPVELLVQGMVGAAFGAFCGATLGMVLAGVMGLGRIAVAVVSRSGPDGASGAQLPFVLASPSFSIRARPAEGRWHEFSIELGGLRFPEAGGDILASFVSQLREVLERTQGTPLAEMEGTPQLEQVRDPQAQYLGHVVFSGYNTLYFHRLPQGTMHVVFADSRGRVLAHARVGDLARDWLPQLRVLSATHR